MTILYIRTAYCNQTKIKKFILSDLQVDENRATTYILPVPYAFAGNRARCNICMKNSREKNMAEIANILL